MDQRPGLPRENKRGTRYPRSFVIETEDTLRRNKSALVKAELQSSLKVDEQATFTSTASDHAVQDTEETTGPSKLPCTTIQPIPSRTAPLQTRSGRIVEPPDRWDL